MTEFPELGFYALAGEADSSRDNTNRWDLAALQRFREHPVVATSQSAIDSGAATEELEQLVDIHS